MGGLELDHVVHINDGSDAAKPVILRLLPGEETIFDLRVVNHGRPTDISLEASDPVFKAVRFRKQDSYVDKEEIIPIMARMPANKNRLDGEILLTSNAGESRLPITLLRDSEDPGIDLEGPGLQGGKDLSNDLIRGGSDPEGVDRDRDEDQRENTGDEGDDADEGDADSDAYDEPYRRTKRNGEDSEDDEDAEEGDDFDALDRMRKPDNDEEEKEPRRIVFSRDRDLQRYRSASRRKSDDNPDEVGAVGGRKLTKMSIDEDLEDSIDKRPDSHTDCRINSRIDDRFVDRSSRQDSALGPNSGEDRPEESNDRQRLPSDLPGDYQDLQPEPDRESEGGREGRGSRRVREIFSPLEANPDAVVPDDGYLDQDGQDFDQDKFGPFGLTQIIPMIIFLALLVALVLTFITYSIPEFAGALGSSILIVTLIIYGAATLLKA
jgi:hypothetical protein